MTVCKTYGGKWILHDIGSEKLKKISEVLYRALVERLRPSLPSSHGSYIPWMASPVFAKDYLENFDQIKILETEGQLDFRSEYLESFSQMVERSSDKVLLDPTRKRKIFSRILEKDAKSLAFFYEAHELTKFWPAWLNTAFNNVVVNIIPICSVRDKLLDGSAFSDHHLIGAIFTSVEYSSPFPDLALNISFAHELGHNALMVYQYSEDLLIEKEKWIYSGVRKTPRPAVMSLHAAVALAYMIEAIIALKSKVSGVDRIAYLDSLLFEYCSGLELGLKALAAVELSSLGKLVVGDLKLLI